MSGPMDPRRLAEIREDTAGGEWAGEWACNALAELLEAHDYHAAAAENNAGLRAHVLALAAKWDSIAASRRPSDRAIRWCARALRSAEAENR